VESVHVHEYAKKTMNSCILMAEIIQEPQLRYTADNQTAITEMVVQFESTRPDDPPATLKAIAWGNRAQEVYDHYKVGDRVVLEGRLTMRNVDRPEGFKEKRAELVVSRVHALGATPATTSQSPPPPAFAAPTPSTPNVVSIESRRQPANSLPNQTPVFTAPSVPQPLAGVPSSAAKSKTYSPDIPSSPPSMPSSSSSDSPSEPDLDEIPF
jgi:single-strand DNA-binding protein